MFCSRIGQALCVASLLSAGPAWAQQQADTLRMGVGAQVTSIDPEYHNISPNNAFAAMVYGALIDTDGQSRLKPGLALSWTALADDLWEFKLRPGVTFHDGTPFTADDVAFTFQRIPAVVNSPGSYSTFIYSIDRVEIPDPLTLRLHTKTPDPLLPGNLTQVWILSRALHTGAATEDFNSGRLAIGTGPFRVASVRFGDRIELDRNDAYWGEKSPWAHVSYRQVTNEAARSASLLSGDVDFIDQVPTADVAHLRNEPKVRLSEADSLRVIYIAMDQGRDGASPFITDNDGRPLDKNPLRDVRVRRALSLAIDRTAEVARVMEGVATPTLQYMAPGTFGYVPDLVPPRANPEEARRLLAEAGYPQGFRITLHGPNDRYPNDFASSRRSRRCGRGSASAPPSRRGPTAASSPAPHGRSSPPSSSRGAPRPANPAPASAPPSPPTTRSPAWVPSTAPATPTPSWTPGSPPPCASSMKRSGKPCCRRSPASWRATSASSPSTCRRTSGACAPAWRTTRASTS